MLILHLERDQLPWYDQGIIVIYGWITQEEV